MMDSENRLYLRLHPQLRDAERILAAIYSAQNGLYATTNLRVLCIREQSIGYNLRQHCYTDLTRVRYFRKNSAWFVELFSGDRGVEIETRSYHEAQRFTQAVERMMLEHGHAKDASQVVSPSLR